MRKNLLMAMTIGAMTLPLAACNDPQDTVTAEQSYGASPSLPAPQTSLIPTVNVAKATGWPAGAKPTAASGMAVNAFATGLDHPRTVYVLPNGDVLVAESNAPPKPDDGKGIKDGRRNSSRNGPAPATPSANRITLLRDADGDGAAETRSVFISGLNSPFGMVLVGDEFYVADTDAILKFPYHTGDTKITAPGVKLADLPAGTINHHWTKDLTASPDGTKLYATVGSNSNVAENGIDAEKDRAAVLEVDRASGQWRVFASGLRNPNGPSWNPQTGELWVVVNERDELGNDLVPDYMTSVKDRRVLWLALQLFRRACRYARPAATAGSRAESDRARLCAGRAHGVAWAHLQYRRPVSRADGRRRLHRPARLVESQAALRLQGDLRAVQGRQALRPPAGHADRLPQRQGRSPRTSGRRSPRQAGRAAGGRRCRQHGVARDTGSTFGGAVIVA